MSSRTGTYAAIYKQLLDQGDGGITTSGFAAILGDSSNENVARVSAAFKHLESQGKATFTTVRPEGKRPTNLWRAIPPGQVKKPEPKHSAPKAKPKHPARPHPTRAPSVHVDSAAPAVADPSESSSHASALGARGQRRAALDDAAPALLLEQIAELRELVKDLAAALKPPTDPAHCPTCTKPLTDADLGRLVREGKIQIGETSDDEDLDGQDEEE